MANFNQVKEEINQYITTNGNQDITGARLNHVMNEILDVVEDATNEAETIIENAETTIQNATTAGVEVIEQKAEESLTVVDNLDSTSDVAALSANQGRILNDEAQTKVSIALGKNLFNPNTLTAGKSFNNAGVIQGNSSYSISDYIIVEEGDYRAWGYYSNILNTKYPLTPNTATVYYIMYDANKQFVSNGTANTQAVSIPSGVKYVRFTINNLVHDITVERGSTSTDYEPYNPISQYLDNYVTETQFGNELDKKLSVKIGKNLFNPDTITPNSYINTAGNIGTNSNYDVSDYIAVEEGDYYITGINNNGVPQNAGTSSACFNLYDENKNKVSTISGAVRLVSIPSGVSFIRIAMNHAWHDYQVEKGTSRTEYEPYSQIGGYTITLPDESVTYNKLSPEVIDLINTETPAKFASFRTNGTLQPLEVLKTADCHVLKNSLLVAKISGNIESVSIGVGINSSNSGYIYNAYWCVLDQTNISIYMYNNVTNVLVGTYPHGMTLTNKTTLSIDTTVDGAQTTVLKLQDDLGNIYTQNLDGWGMGTAFIRNDNTTNSVDAELSFMPRDITKRIWAFGDSYFSFSTSVRWPYYFVADKETNWLSNNLPGLSPEMAYNDMLNLLSLGYIPSYVLWTLGMNGNTAESMVDGQYVINSYQKTYIDNVVSLCNQYNITPVLACIPTVPDRQKTGFCNYVKSLGVRYVDFAEAVGTNSSGQWNTGLLSSDNVHPTAAGAKVLYSRVLIDFPEIAITE